MNLKDIGGLMKQAQALQEKMGAMQEEAANLTVTGEAGAGLCRVEMNGRHEVRRVMLDDALMREEKGVIEDLVAAACNDAAQRVEAAREERMRNMARDLGLPAGMPFGKMPF
ncbi:MAG: YbaB/EbfC family nucleoid-associated protein [Pseudomonadales bacterium]